MSKTNKSKNEACNSDAYQKWIAEQPLDDTNDLHGKLIAIHTAAILYTHEHCSAKHATNIHGIEMHNDQKKSANHNTGGMKG